MPPRSASSLLFPNSNAAANSNGLVVDRDPDAGADVEENSYLEPIRLAGQQQTMPAVWSPNSRPLSSSSLISSSSSPISPSAAGNLYANNEALLAAAAAAAANNDTGLLHHHLDPSMMMMTGSVTMETVLVPPPVAYANLHHEMNNSGNAVKDPRLMMVVDQDDLSADEADNQQHLYINVGPDAIEVIFQK
jgi:hypothetical protein